LSPAHRSAFLAALIFVPALCGCGSSTPMLDTATVEHAIAASIRAQHDLNTKVSCPPEVPRRAGVHFTCTAGLDVGAYPIQVTETNGGGRVRYEDRAPLAALDVARVERAIEHSIRSQRRLAATVTCPTEVIRRAGVAFTCTADVNGRHYPFSVIEVDGSGHVRYVGRRRSGHDSQVSG
jgi:Domain of unknown function (DUF4333)